MPKRIRLEHSTLADGRFHVFTSPDLKGLHVSGESLAGAQREAIAVVDRIAELDGDETPIITFMEMAGAV